MYSWKKELKGPTFPSEGLLLGSYMLYIGVPPTSHCGHPQSAVHCLLVVQMRNKTLKQPRDLVQVRLGISAETELWNTALGFCSNGVLSSVHTVFKFTLLLLPQTWGYSHKCAGREAYTCYRGWRTGQLHSRHQFLGYKWKLLLIVITLRSPSLLISRRQWRIAFNWRTQTGEMYCLLCMLHFLALLLPLGAGGMMLPGAGGLWAAPWGCLCHQVWAAACWEQACILPGIARGSEHSPSASSTSWQNWREDGKKTHSLITTHVCALAERTQCDCGPKFCD